MWTGDQREPDVLPGCSEACFLTPVGYHHLEGGQPEATEIVTKVEWGGGQRENKLFFISHLNLWSMKLILIQLKLIHNILTNTCFKRLFF